MAERLPERLDQLEQAVRRTAELITRLRAERSQFEAERAALERRLAGQAQELDTLRAHLARLERGQEELSRLRGERNEVLAQVEGILKELARLERA